MRTNLVRAALAAAFLIASAGLASAHVSISTGPAQATRSQKITFGIGHGCDGADTISVRVVIPAGITSVRALPNGDFKPTIEGTPAAVTAVVWTKPVEAVLDADYAYHELTIRARVGDVPFSKLYFSVYQTCRAMDGTISNHDWIARPGETGVINPGDQFVYFTRNGQAVAFDFQSATFTPPFSFVQAAPAPAPAVTTPQPLKRKYLLRTSNGFLVTAEGGGGRSAPDAMATNRRVTGPWEAFALIPLGNDSYAFRTETFENEEIGRAHV